MDWVWWGHGATPRMARAALTPLELLYRGAVKMRGTLYDVGALPAYPAPIPTLSIGNIAVGGAGKTPVAAWFAAALADRGVHPALVLRGYGSDEPMVHERLNPTIPVVVSPDRVAGIARAAADGADVAVLDDGFQHRRTQRTADVVLVNADRWSPIRRLLPAGPWREPASALRRASLLVVTRKVASTDVADAAARYLQRIAPHVPLARVHLAPAELRQVRGEGTRPLETLRGMPVLAISAVADPGAFQRQLEMRGARVRACALSDHHPFDSALATRLAESLGAGETAVCTLKDAVKLAPVWPRAAGPLWYVSQRLIVEQGAEAIDSVLALLLGACRTQDASQPSPAGLPAAPPLP